MDRLLTIEVFVRVAETLSFTRASDVLNLPRSTVSAAIRELEAHLNTRLINRTTRKVSLTTDGTVYHDWCRHLLADIEQTELRMRSAADGASGRLRVEVPGRIARRIICPALPDFLASHPQLALEMGVSDRTADLVKEGIDCAIRVGKLTDSSLVAHSIGPLRVGTFASQSYLSDHGIPQTIDNLSHHRIVQYTGTISQTTAPQLWYRDHGNDKSVSVRASIAVDDADTYIACCRAGLGLIQVPAYDVSDLLESGELVEVLSDRPPAPMPMSAVYPERRYTSARVHVFVEWLKELYASHMRDG
ncbi:LysR family transcriptional regulator [Granulosicoccus sp. 3-233]|uniref:LysR family transcriptional regulator n=1 Tax=Granulosicoccus sp. 3-233 TaxID=3417969 RepID=UPI003D3264AF